LAAEKKTRLVAAKRTTGKDWKFLRLNHDSRHWKVDRVLANHSLGSTASQGTSNIPFPWFLLSQCNRQARNQERKEKCAWRGPCESGTVFSFARSISFSSLSTVDLANRKRDTNNGFPSRPQKGKRRKELAAGKRNHYWFPRSTSSMVLE